MIDIGDLLQKTSRTFALAIPLLPEPARREVGLAYLLFRIADTLEDSTTWSRAERIAALDDLASAFSSVDVDRVARLRDGWAARPPCDHAGYLELLAVAPDVLAEVKSLDAGARDIVVDHVARTTRGMSSVLARSDEHGRLELANVAELREYCYLVAGIVGELLTALFIHDAPDLARERTVLESTTRAFGEGLQLVNILKDETADASDGRAYLPKAVTRREVIDLARADLDAAAEYIAALDRGGAPPGFIAFTDLSAKLARATLTKLDALGPGAKVSRAEVAEIFAQIQRDLDARSR